MVSTMPVPRRRDAIATATAIENAAVDLVLEHGYDAVTVDMICARAAVSQRSFFNHFRTKDLAVIGADEPTIDEDAARSFVASTGPLLAEATQLIRIDVGGMTHDPTLLARRIRAVGANPVLLARQIERLSAVEREMAEIIERRLRTQHPHEDAAALREQAHIITHLLAGVMRYIGQSWAQDVHLGGTTRTNPMDITAALQSAIARLS